MAMYCAEYRVVQCHGPLTDQEADANRILLIAGTIILSYHSRLGGKDILRFIAAPSPSAQGCTGKSYELFAIFLQIVKRSKPRKWRMRGQGGGRYRRGRGARRGRRCGVAFEQREYFPCGTCSPYNAQEQWCPHTIHCDIYAFTISHALENVYCSGRRSPYHATLE